MWVGILKYRCVDINTGVVGNDEEICGFRECGEFKKCVKILDNPNKGATNFDNVFYSMLTVF